MHECSIIYEKLSSFICKSLLAQGQKTQLIRVLYTSQCVKLLKKEGHHGQREDRFQILNPAMNIFDTMGST
jgi:hypothetical protein